MFRHRVHKSRTCTTPPPRACWLLLLTAACADDSLHMKRDMRAPEQVTAGAAGVMASDAPASGNAEHPLLPPADPASREALPTGQCAKVDLTVTRVTPTIWLVVDGSGSMRDPLSQTEATSRWDALRGALLDPSTGVVSALQHQVSWAMVMYDGPTSGLDAVSASAPAANSCPRVVVVEPKLDNLHDIEQAYPAVPLGGSTPTDKALEAVSAHLPAQGARIDMQKGPTLVVLATDGQPNDYCTQSLFPPDVRPRVLDAVQRLHATDTKLYVVSLAGDDAQLTDHLLQVAAAGGTDKPYLIANKDQLIETFRNIIGPHVSCEIALESEFEPSRACAAKVMLNGDLLPCDSPDGFQLASRTTLVLKGRACETYQNDALAVLHAEFPCPPLD